MSIKKKTDLHPWGTVISLLFEEESDVVVKIIDRTGLQIDWTLTQEQSGTHKQRKREYRPRIQTAYDSLSDEDKLRVAFVVATELAHIDEGHTERVSSVLKNIGWKIESKGLTTDEGNLIEMFFPKRKPYDAYVEIKAILQQATKEVIIIDPYIDGSILQMLSTVSSSGLHVRLLSFNLSKDFGLEAKKFLSQLPTFVIELRTTKEFHDRFVILDGSHCNPTANRDLESRDSGHALNAIHQ